MKTRNLILIMVVIVGAFLCAVSVSSCRKKTDDTALRIASDVKAVNKLVLSQMSINKMASLSDIDFSKATGFRQSAEAILDALKIGDRKAVYSYNTYMRAFVDLSSFSPEDVEVDESAKTVTITLPAVQTEFAGRDPQIKEEHYRVTGFRSDVGAGERAEIKEEINSALRHEVENDDTFRKVLVESAQNKGRKYFEDLCGRYGYKAVVSFGSHS